MCNPANKEQTSAEAAPKRPRRKYKPNRLGSAGFSARLAKRGSFKTSWEGLFFDIKGRV